MRQVYVGKGNANCWRARQVSNLQPLPSEGHACDEWAASVLQTPDNATRLDNDYTCEEFVADICRDDRPCDLCLRSMRRFKMTIKDEPEWVVGDYVQKVGGDARFDGIVVAAFQKLDKRSWRYVVEDDRGLLMIYSGKNLEEMSIGSPGFVASDEP